MLGGLFKIMEKKIYICYFDAEDDTSYELLVCDSIEQAKQTDDYELIEEYKESTYWEYDDDEELGGKEVSVKEVLDEYKDYKGVVVL